MRQFPQENRETFFCYVRGESLDFFSIENQKKEGFQD